MIAKPFFWISGSGVLAEGTTGPRSGSGGHTAAECCCYGVHDEEGQFPHSCSFMNVVGVADQLKGSEEFTDRDKFIRVEEMRIELQSNFGYNLGYIA